MDSNEEVEMEETEDMDILDTVKTLIEGCEDFVVDQIHHCRQTTAKARKLALSDASEKADEKFKTINDNINSLETAIKAVNDRTSTNPEKQEEKRKEIESIIEERISKKIKAIEASLNLKELEIMSLKKEIKQIKRQCKCKELFKAYVDAGNDIMREDDKVTEGSVDVSSLLPDDCDILFVSDAFLNSTDVTSPTPGPSHIDSNTINVEQQVAELNSEPQVNQNSKIITSLQELPEDLRRSVSNHVKDSPYSTKEKLSKLQVAYIRNYLHNLSTASSREPSVVAKNLLDQGVRDKIWSNTFLPEGVKNFPTYLVTRVKNELSHLKTLELAAFAENQQERLKTNSQ